MTTPALTLEKVQETAKVKVSRVSDFLTDEEIGEIHKSNLKGRKRKGFNRIDSYVAEIISRFGYDTYVAWKTGEIEETQMVKYIEAERARETRARVMLESIIVASVAGANNPTKTGQTPKSLKTALKVLKSEQELMKGIK